MFAQKDVSFVSAKRIGANGNYAKFIVEIMANGYPRRSDLMYFGDVDAFCVFLEERYGAGSADSLFEGRGTYLVSVTYQIGINSYKGRESLQYIMQNYC